MKGKFVLADSGEGVDRELREKRTLTEAELLRSLLFSLNSTRLKFSALVCMHLALLHIFSMLESISPRITFGHIFTCILDFVCYETTPSGSWNA